MGQLIKAEVNGTAYEYEAEPNLPLVEFLRETLELTGTNAGCEDGRCGACTVHVDGEAVRACALLAVQVDGARVTTIEGLASNGEPHPLQKAFWDYRHLQCGDCTPGMIMAAAALLERNSDPSEAEIRAALEGIVCRCTSYHNLVKAVRQAAATVRSGDA